jgi:membrane associated rhomboid family serine protease
MFVHAGWLHLGANMLYLWVFGDNVEDRLGHLRFALLYLGSGLVAALAQVVVAGAPDVPLVGASGAVAGVLGAYIVTFPHARVASLLTFPLSLLAFVLRARLNLLVVSIVELPAWIVLLGWVWAQLQGLSMPVGGVAYAAHVGGFAAGIVLLLRLRRSVPDLTPAGRRRSAGGPGQWGR